MQDKGVSLVELASKLPSIANMEGSFRVDDLEELASASENLAGICRSGNESNAVASFEGLSSETNHLIEKYSS